MQRFYIASGFALMWMLSSITAIAWVSHHEKTIVPGESVTVFCEDSTTSIDVVDCGDELVVSPSTCGSR